VNRLSRDEKRVSKTIELLIQERRNDMQKDLMDKEKRGGDIVTVSISDETIEQIISMGDDVAMWAKMVDNGFSINDKTFSKIEGVIIDIKPYLVKWDNNKPYKIPNVANDEEIPADYERRVDLKILINGQIVGISLPKSSFKNRLSPYLRHLKNNGLRPEEVVTRLRSSKVSNVHGTFNVAAFEMLGSAKNVTAKKVEPQSGPDQGPPPVPSSATEQETPSAIPPEWA